MIGLCLGLIVLATALCAPMCAALVAAGHRMGTFDSAGVAGQVKDRARRVPNTGGIAIFWSIVLPLAGVLVLANVAPGWLPEAAQANVSYIVQKTALAAVLLGCLLLLHVLGLVDDRRPLPPLPKLVLMLIPAFAAPIAADTRLLTLLDPIAGGPWLSILVTAAWFLAITNAINFLDNMDGLSAGIGAIVSACLLVVTVDKQQWLLAGCLSLTIGACVGFLMFNAPRAGGARLFMGDGGSLVIGFLLAFVTVRVTYYDPASPQATRAHAVFMPLIILALPLYDLLVVTSVRLWRGKSPMVGDLNHTSHRLVRRGLSRAGAVYLLWGVALIVGIGGVALARVDEIAAAFIGTGVLLVLALLAGFEYASPALADSLPASEGERAP